MYDFPMAYLNSNDGSGLLAFGDGERLYAGQQPLVELENFLEKHAGKFIFGYLGYDLKNRIEELASSNPDRLQFPELFFWVPEWVVELRNEHVSFLQGTANGTSYDFINYFLEEETDQNYHPYRIEFRPRISRERYMTQVESLIGHLRRGDIYEVNYCQEFFAENVRIKNPLDTYFKLNNITRAPFSGFFQFDQFSAFCGSPERYLKKEGQHLITQPIKGTSRRGATETEDKALIEALQNDPKERAENVMIVDLVRNDFSRIAEKNSVQVDELCGIYTFESVHQMISTVSCDLKAGTSFTDILRATFPMGSMTGAPKISAMNLIEEHEDFKRGLYSGSIGYIRPNGDFDFNVVIRSLLYNSEEEYLSCGVGSAITIRSDAEKEYEECFVKVNRILQGMNE